jgi:hypothetical protein
MIHVQQIRYLEALPRIINYAAVALTSIEFVETPSAPPTTASKHILYSQLFEELKAI